MLNEELIRRIELLKKVNVSPELQAIEMKLCEGDILYRFRTYAYTDKNKSLFTNDEPTELPFIPFPFQEECIEEVRNAILTKQSVFIEKSRQMGISRLIMGIYVYGYLFHGHKYLVISQKQDDVDTAGDMKSLFEKARFMLRNLPNRMLPPGYSREVGTECNKSMNISRRDSSGSITGESANPNASRGGTYDSIFGDEFAFQSNASTINKAMISASPCRIYASTPNGQGNEQYRMKMLAERRKDKYGADIAPVLVGLRYHRSEHPLYDKKRYLKKISGMDEQTIAQELEIDYNTAIKGRVYTAFAKEPVLLEYNPEKPMYVAIDNSHGGQDPNAIIIVQPEGAYRNCIDYIEMNTTPEDTASFLSCQPKGILTDQQNEFQSRYKLYNRRKAIFISDPYDTKVAMGNSTILDDYKKVGINLMIPENRDKKEQILKTRTNIYKIRYNNNCLDFASAILNARYPETKEDSNSTQPKELPVHNRTSHARTALEYFMTYVLENPLVGEEKPQIAVDTRPYKDKVTGQMRYR